MSVHGLLPRPAPRALLPRPRPSVEPVLPEDLAALSPPQAALLGRLLRRVEPWCGELGGIPVAVALHRTDEEPRPQGELRVLARWGDDRVALSVPEQVVAILLARWETDPDRLRRLLPHPTGALLVELALAPALEPVERDTAVALRVDAVELPPRADGEPPIRGVAVGLIGRIADLSFSGRLQLDESAAERLARLVESRPAGHDRDRRLPVTVAWRIGITRLRRSELAELRVGDALVLTDTLLTDDQLIVVVGERRIAVASMEDSVLVLRGSLMLPDDRMMRRWTMSKKNEAEPRQPPCEGTIDDIEITIVFELGRVTMTLEEIDKLGDGHVFDLGRQLRKAPVDCLANGHRIGRGEIVRIGDSVGVRITRLT